MNAHSFLSKNFIGCECDYAAADIALFGAPFDGTTSNKPGARFAGAAVRAESIGIETYSPYLERDLADLAICDLGELDLPFGNAAAALDIITDCTAKIFRDGKFPVMLGGEHLVTLGAVRAAAAVYDTLCVIQFDAHADLRDDYLGEPLSHACVMRRCYDILGDGRIFQLGIRSGTREEFEFAGKHTVMRKFDCGNIKDIVRAVGKKSVYVTIDLDVLDPSEFPAAGTPEAGGISWLVLREALAYMGALGVNVIGCDINEYSPPYDVGNTCAALAAKTLRELLLTFCGKFRSTVSGAER